MEDSKIEERKNFMKRIVPQFLVNFQSHIAAYQDPLKKREEFAVSLRKKKTTEIINAKRRRLIQGAGGAGAGAGQTSEDSQPTDSKNSAGLNQHYKGHDKYEKNLDEFNQILG